MSTYFSATTCPKCNGYDFLRFWLDERTSSWKGKPKWDDWHCNDCGYTEKDKQWEPPYKQATSGMISGT